MATLTNVWDAYFRAVGRWSGCDWPTRFGSLELNLEGVSAQQARNSVRRWRSIELNKPESDNLTTLETSCLYKMVLCIRLQLAQTENKLDCKLAPIPSRSLCAKAIAEEWEIAAWVLEEIESDAKNAETEAWSAVCAAKRAQWNKALKHARRAAVIEAGYFALNVWVDLKNVIEAAAVRSGHRVSSKCAESSSQPDRGAIVTRQQQEKEHAGDNSQDTCKARIAAAVIAALGKPDNFRAVDVRQVWANHYRVNVRIGMDAASSLIAHSYFLKIDSNGGVLNACPEIQKRY